MVHNLLFPTLLLLLSSALQAAPDWHECRQISTDNERLACYDNYVSGLDKGASTPDIKEQKSAFGLPKKTPADDLQNSINPITISAIFRASGMQQNKAPCAGKGYSLVKHGNVGLLHA